MAHKSKKKHLKHVHAHEPTRAAPRAKKRAGAKSDVELDRQASTRVGGKADKPKAGKAAKPTKKPGLVGKLANVAAKPKRVIKRVKKLFGREK